MKIEDEEYVISRKALDDWYDSLSSEQKVALLKRLKEIYKDTND